MLTTVPHPIKLSRNEGLKTGRPLSAGTIAQALADRIGGPFQRGRLRVSEVPRDLSAGRPGPAEGRKALHADGADEVSWRGAERGAVPGVRRADQRYGNDTMRITTRQDFQFHGILKANLRQAVTELNEALISTLAACGDVARNVMAPPTPATSPLVERGAGRGAQSFGSAGTQDACVS